MSKSHKPNRRVIPTPAPPRKLKRPGDEEETATEAAKHFLDRLVRDAGAAWFRDHTGRILGSTWNQEITPEVGREWLERVDETHQRTRTEGTVKRYASDIRGNRFVPLIPMAIFDRFGRLINSQHVLKAFVDSGTPYLAVTVQVNLHEFAYQAPDQNKKRSVRDTLKWVGVDRSGDVSGVVTVLFQYLKGYYSGKGYMSARGSHQLPTNAEAEELAKQYPEIPNHLWKSPSAGGGFSLPAFRAASVILHQIDADRARKFFESLVKGLNFSDPTDPVYVLHSAIMRAHATTTDRGGWRHGETLLRIFKAWNHHLRGGGAGGGLLTPQNLYRKGELFQEPQGPLPIPESPRASPRVH